MVDENPYASPQAAEAGDYFDFDALPPEEIRRRLVRHETALRQIGTLWLLVAAVLLCMSLVWIIGPQQSNLSAGIWPVGLLAALMAATGSAVRQLQPWARLPLVATSLLGGTCCCFPMAPAALYGLYLALTTPGQMVFSQRYHEIVRATPEIALERNWALTLYQALAVLLAGSTALLVLIRVLAAL